MKRIIILLFLILSGLYSIAQSDTSKIRISILTCGAGEELYSSFGHSGVRVVDSAKGVDEVYNYGLFNFRDPNFYEKFTRGKLLYFVGKTSFRSFVEDYEYEERSVVEQELRLTPIQKQSIVAYLENNLKPENRSYHYDFLYDNCATRIRDIFPKALGADFKFGQVFENGQQFTFRNLLHEYLKNLHWPRFGIDILLGSRIDQKMNNDQAMFLPDLLMKGLSTATFKNQKIVGQNNQILNSPDRSAAKPNLPMWTMLAVLILTMIVFFVPALKNLKVILSFLLLFISGLLGLFLLFMWFGTNHQSCAYNFNLLWAFPLNIFAAFTIFKPRIWHKKYAISGIVLLLLSLIVHLTGVQELPIIEILPFMLCLLYAYLFVYKRAIAK